VVEPIPTLPYYRGLSELQVVVVDSPSTDVVESKNSTCITQCELGKSSTTERESCGADEERAFSVAERDLLIVDVPIAREEVVADAHWYGWVKHQC